ncbi:MAG: aminopeptidase P family protein, partial [Bacteroidales bacterium]
MKKQVLSAMLVLINFLFIINSVFSGELLFEKPEYRMRREKLMDAIPDGFAIIPGSRHVTGYDIYFQNNDFFYFTGVEIPNSILIIDGVRRESILFFTIAERSAASEGISLDLVRDPTEYTGIERYMSYEQFSNTLSGLADRYKVIYTSIYPEELIRECSSEKFNVLRRDVMLNEWDGRLTRELQFVKILKERFPQAVIHDCSKMIWDLRIIKSKAEIEHLRKVGKIGVRAHTEMIRATRPGMYEYEVAALFEYYCKKEGARDLAYNVIISSAENHPYLHYYKHDRYLVENDFLVVDAGPDLGYYDIDITVSYPANGEFTPRQEEIYTACNEIEKACFKFYAPGLTRQDVGKKAKEYLVSKGFDLSTDVYQKMMRYLENGGVSHYVGMAVHDVGGSPRDTLKTGMVFALDILAVFPDEDMGVRVEDTVVITENGC